VTAPATPPVQKKEEKKDNGKEGEDAVSTRAKLIVELPADAKLFIDDQPTKATSAKRLFNTPRLQPGQKYYYELRAVLVREGQTVQQTRRVILSPGDEIRASFNELEAMATAQINAQKR
jgi:uncharacterized protein (TIGR03000 family)